MFPVLFPGVRGRVVQTAEWVHSHHDAMEMSVIIYKAAVKCDFSSPGGQVMLHISRAWYLPFGHWILPLSTVAANCPISFVLCCEVYADLFLKHNDFNQINNKNLCHKIQNWFWLNLPVAPHVDQSEKCSTHKIFFTNHFMTWKFSQIKQLGLVDSLPSRRYTVRVAERSGRPRSIC